MRSAASSSRAVPFRLRPSLSHRMCPQRCSKTATHAARRARSSLFPLAELQSRHDVEIASKSATSGPLIEAVALRTMTLERWSAPIRHQPSVNKCNRVNSKAPATSRLEAMKAPSPAGTPKGMSRRARRAGTRRLRAHCARRRSLTACAERMSQLRRAVGGGWRSSRTQHASHKVKVLSSARGRVESCTEPRVIARVTGEQRRARWGSGSSDIEAPSPSPPRWATATATRSAPP